MLVQVIDALGDTQQVSWQAQDTINDLSSTLGAGAVGAAPEPKQVAPANTSRAGFLFQNTSGAPMLLVEVATADIEANGWTIAPGAFFPPPGYPIPTGVIQVQGTQFSAAGDTFTAREWVNPPSTSC